MTEPYHSFIKRKPENNDRDNLCAICDRGPGDPVHNPTPENYCVACSVDRGRVVKIDPSCPVHGHMIKVAPTPTTPAQPETLPEQETD